MKVFEIPGYKTLSISFLVLDMNGTMAVDGIVSPEVKDRLSQLAADFDIRIITADTFGTAKDQFENMPLQLTILEPGDQTMQKSMLVSELGAESCVAIGNGFNDSSMLKQAAIGIVVVGTEGASTQAVQSGDIVCASPVDALDLLLHPKRLIASLRR